MEAEKILQEVQFDPKVKLYWYLQGVWLHLMLVFAFVGVFTLPIWIVVGWFVAAKRYEHLEATLTETSIHLKQGYITKVEKTIPLEKIQDVGMRTGPLLNLFGIASIQIETAGSSAPGSDMVLAGVVDPANFRNAVLSQRGKVSGVGPAAASGDPDSLGVLTDIRDSLQRIEGLLKKD
jgi:putative membrane protein